MLLVAGADAGLYLDHRGRALPPAKEEHSCVSAAGGHFCGEAARQSLGGAWLCDAHLFTGRREAGRHAACERRTRQLERSLDRALERIGYLTEPDAVVYYVLRHSDGLVKIGTSLRFAKRMRRLRLEHGHLSVLAAQRGSLALETEMHDRFASLHVGAEWFRGGPELLEWIRSLRESREHRAATPAQAVSLPELRILLQQISDTPSRSHGDS
jgi:hypothetical protein